MQRLYKRHHHDWSGLLVVQFLPRSPHKHSPRGQSGEASGEAERVLLEDVRESINDLVQLMITYRSKNKLSKVVTSSLCKRRQEEAEAAIDMALSRLQASIRQNAEIIEDIPRNYHAKQENQPQNIFSEVMILVTPSCNAKLTNYGYSVHSDGRGEPVSRPQLSLQHKVSSHLAETQANREFHRFRFALLSWACRCRLDRMYVTSKRGCCCRSKTPRCVVVSEYQKKTLAAPRTDHS